MASNKNQLLGVLDYARYSPSVHNSQPWQFELKENAVIVRLDEGRAVKSGDPIGRQTWISLGCCVEAISVAAAKFGWQASVKPSLNKSVEVKFSKLTKTVVQEEIALADAIKHRFTDRSSYSAKAVPKSVMDRLNNCRAQKGTSVVVTDDKAIIDNVARLTANGIQLALSNPDFRKELSAFISSPRKSSASGISTKSLGLNPLRGVLEPGIVKLGWNTKRNAQKDYQNWSTAPLLILVFSEGDSRQYWHDAGRTYMRLALLATSLGLRSSTSAAAVEASDFHEDIEAAIGTKQRLQTIMRAGYSHSRIAHSPRLPLEELLT